jgi:hypothetical protein
LQRPAWKRKINVDVISNNVASASPAFSAGERPSGCCTNSCVSQGQTSQQLRFLGPPIGTGCGQHHRAPVHQRQFAADHQSWTSPSTDRFFLILLPDGTPLTRAMARSSRQQRSDGASNGYRYSRHHHSGKR